MSKTVGINIETGASRDVKLKAISDLCTAIVNVSKVIANDQTQITISDCNFDLKVENQDDYVGVSVSGDVKEEDIVVIDGKEFEIRSEGKDNA